MNVELWEAALWGAAGGMAWTIPAYVRTALRRRRWERERRCPRLDDYLTLDETGGR